jgi:hypothetical protein
MVFCKNCGKELPSKESQICPACEVTQKDIPTTIVTLSPKNSGTTTIIALVAGFFGFNGVGHIYIGKTKYGIGAMLLGWLLIGLTVIGAITNPILGIIGIASSSDFIDCIGSLYVVGEVEDNTPTDAKFVKITGTFYDTNNQVVATDFTYTSPSDISSGGKAPFELILSSAIVPTSLLDHYDLVVSNQ